MFNFKTKQRPAKSSQLINFLQAKMWYLIIFSVLIIVLWVFKWANYYPAKIDLQPRADFFGVTFSTKFCNELGLDWKEVYTAMLDELRVKYVRLPIYWDELEKQEGVFDFTNYDYLVNEGEKRGVKFIISMGRRVPRWPECHSPAWLNYKSEIGARVSTLVEVRKIMEHYRGRDSVVYWQVENEPFLSTFGVCPPLDVDFLKQEFELAHNLDSRPVIITGSGELSRWSKEAKIGDIFGSTLYRVVYNSWFGYVKYPFPLSYYRLKARAAGLANDRVMLMELQAEPWVPRGNMTYLSTRQINKTMSIAQFRANLQYAIDLDFQQAYLWGVEWWYWQKKYGNPEYWWIAANLFK